MTRYLDLENAVQINDGLTQTSADGVNMAFDRRYGVMFCAYMPGPHGHYGESRGRISLTYFPASQPTNAKTVTVAAGEDVYTPNVLSLGDGKVRVTYEKNSRAEGDHTLHYKDYDYLSDTLSDERTVMLKTEDGVVVPLTQSVQFAYLQKRGFTAQTPKSAEQLNLGGSTLFCDSDGTVYGAITTYLSEPVLYRSDDNLATVEFFAVCPYPAQYELDFKRLNGVLYAVYRTPDPLGSIKFVTSADNGKTWSAPMAFKDSIPCRPRVIVHNGHILAAYNYDNADTGNRPAIQQNRTAVRLRYGENPDPEANVSVADLHSNYGIVNVCLTDVLGDVYLAYSTSVLALEYQNGNPLVRGKDAIRYVKLGDLTL